MKKTKKMIFMDLKKPDNVININPISSQDIIEIDRISLNGIFKVGDDLYSKSYLFDDVNYVTLSYDEQVMFFGEWCKVLNTFDTFVKITVFNKNRNMEQLRNEVLHHKKHDGYDYIRNAYNDIIESKIVEGRQGIEQVKFITVTIKRNNYEDAKNYLASVENNLGKAFSLIGSSIYPLNGNERLRVLYNFYRCGEEELFNIDISNLMEAGSCDWKNDIAPSYIDFNSDMNSFRTDRKVCKALYVDPSSYPNTLGDVFFDKLTNINSCSVFSMDFISIPKDITLKTLESKLMSIEEQITKQQQKRNRRKDFSSDISYRVRMDKKDLEEMLTDVRDNDQGMFWCGTTIVLMEDDENMLRNAETNIKSIAEGHSCMLKPYTNWQREALNTALPIGVHEVDKFRTMFTQTAAIHIPFSVREIKPKKDPRYYGINQVTKNPIRANRKYDLVNGNGFVFGVPGSGKSFTGSKMEIGTVFLESEDDIVIVDPTLEYFSIVNTFNGATINLAPNTKDYFNPCDVDLEKLRKDDSNGIIREKCDFMVSLCQQCMEAEFKPAHKSLISRCTQNIYMKIAELPVDERYMPILSDIYEELKYQEEKEISQDIKLAMEIFITGALNIYNHRSNKDIKNRIVAFGMRDLGENLFAVSMLIMLEYIKLRIIKNAELGVATWLYIDEYHLLCKKSYTSIYLDMLWKTVRKLGGLCTGITQNISPIMKDDVTATLVCNSEYTMFLKQAQKDADVILENFNFISEAQLRYVLNAEPGTGLIRFNNIVQPLDNTVDKNNIIYDLFNTNLHEKMAKKKEMEEREEITETA